MLVTLNDIKTYLGVSGSTYDAFLTAQGEYISEAIEGFCGRKFASASYVQTFYASDYSSYTKELKLYHYPIITLDGINVDDVAADLADFRLQKPTGTLIKPTYFFNYGVEEVEVTYTAGFTDVPAVVKNVLLSILEEKYNKKVSGVALNFGSDVQRVSVPGVISIDFDYTLEANMRKNAYGVILGNYMNMLDPLRSERALLGSGKITYVT